MKKSVSLVMALCIVLAFSLSAMAADKEITWMVGTTAEQLVGYQALMDHFEAETGIKVNIVPNESSKIREKLTAMIAAKKIPEFTCWGTKFVDWAARGAMAPLDEYVANSDVIDLSLFDEGAIRAMTWNDQLWALPYCSTSYVLYYNQDLFDEMGIEYPYHTWDDESWTLEAFIELAQQMTLDNEGRNALDPAFDKENIVQYGLASPLDYWMAIWYYGGDWVAQDGKTYIGDSEEAIQSLQLFSDFYNKYYICPNTAAAETFAQGGNVMLTGKCAMTMDGSWSASSYIQAPFKWNISALPKGTQHALVDYTDAFGIGGGCADPESMWVFIEWLYSDVDHVMEFYGANSAYLTLPSFKPAKELIWQKIEEKFPELNIEILKTLSDVPERKPIYARYSPFYGELDVLLKNEVRDAIRTGEETDVRKLLTDEDRVERIKAILNQEL